MANNIYQIILILSQKKVKNVNSYVAFNYQKTKKLMVNKYLNNADTTTKN